MNSEKHEMGTVNTASGKIIVSKNDSWKTLYVNFEKYLSDTSHAKPETIRQTVRIVSQVLDDSIPSQQKVILQPNLVSWAFMKMGDREDGFLARKANIYTPNYVLKICESCKKAVDFLVEGGDDEFRLGELEGLKLKRSITCFRSKNYLFLSTFFP